MRRRPDCAHRPAPGWTGPRPRVLRGPWADGGAAAIGRARAPAAAGEEGASLHSLQVPDLLLRRHRSAARPVGRPTGPDRCLVPDIRERLALARPARSGADGAIGAWEQFGGDVGMTDRSAAKWPLSGPGTASQGFGERSPNSGYLRRYYGRVKPSRPIGALRTGRIRRALTIRQAADMPQATSFPGVSRGDDVACERMDQDDAATVKVSGPPGTARPLPGPLAERPASLRAARLAGARYSTSSDGPE
jgi:hypothetical protein